MRIGHLNPRSDIYGPGTRFVIWTQGCSLRCPGCWNRQFWNPRGGTEVPLAELLAQIESHRPVIEGITVLGGEPFEQPEALAELTAAVQAQGLSVVVYSGYMLEEIETLGYGPILVHCDILIDGRYEEQQRSLSLRWRGSTNQRVLFLSPRYRNFELAEAQEIEIVLQADGSEVLYGYPEGWDLNQ